MKKAISGLYWVTGAQYTSTMIRFMGGIYLARMIDPVFFGQQGLVISVSMLVWSFTMIGEEPALLKKQDDVGNYMQMLLFVRVIIVYFLIAVMVFLWSVGWLPGSGDVRNYIIIVFLLQAFTQVGAIYMANIQKLMFFRRLALYSLLPTVIAVSLACLLAFLGYKIWALLWLIIAEQLVQVILIILMSPKIFLPKFNKPLALEFFHFSKYAVSGNLLDRFHCQIDKISVGSLIGERPLGFYQRAYSIGGLMQSVLTGGLSTIVQPYFSKMQDYRDKFGEKFELMSSLLVRVSCAFYICMALILPEAIKLVYGEKWIPAVPLFRLLLPFAILHGFRVILRNTHQVAGSVKLLARAQIIETLTLLVLLYPLIYWKGVFGVPFAVNISFIVGVSMMLYYLKQYADFSIWRIFANPLISSLVAAFIALWFKSAVSSKFGDILNMGTLIVVFFGSFVITLLLLEYSYIKKTVFMFIRAT
jgi:O-antigen/teichoic acid export membrane protein